MEGEGMMHADDLAFLSQLSYGDDIQRWDAESPEEGPSMAVGDDTKSGALVAPLAEKRPAEMPVGRADVLKSHLQAWVLSFRQRKWEWRAGVLADGQRQYFQKLRGIHQWHAWVGELRMRDQMLRAACDRMRRYRLRQHLQRWVGRVRDSHRIRRAAEHVRLAVSPSCRCRRALRRLWTNRTRHQQQRCNARVSKVFARSAALRRSLAAWRRFAAARRPIRRAERAAGPALMHLKARLAVRKWRLSAAGSQRSRMLMRVARQAAARMQLKRAVQRLRASARQKRSLHFRAERLGQRLEVIRARSGLARWLLWVRGRHTLRSKMAILRVTSARHRARRAFRTLREHRGANQLSRASARTAEAHWRRRALKRAVRLWAVRAASTRQAAVDAGELRVRWRRWCLHVRRRRTMRVLARRVVRSGRAALARRQLLRWRAHARQRAAERFNLRCAALFRRRVLLHRWYEGWRAVATSRRRLRVKLLAARSHRRRTIVHAVLRAWSRQAVANRGLRGAAKMRRRRLLQLGFRLIAARHIMRRRRSAALQRAIEAGRRATTRGALRAWQRVQRREAVLHGSRTAVDHIRRKGLLGRSLRVWLKSLHRAESMRRAEAAVQQRRAVAVSRAALARWAQLLRIKTAKQEAARRMVAWVRARCVLGPAMRTWRRKDASGRRQDGAIRRAAGLFASSFRKRKLSRAIQLWLKDARESIRIKEASLRCAEMSVERRCWSALARLRGHAVNRTHARALQWTADQHCRRTCQAGALLRLASYAAERSFRRQQLEQASQLAGMHLKKRAFGRMRRFVLLFSRLQERPKDVHSRASVAQLAPNRQGSHAVDRAGSAVRQADWRAPTKSIALLDMAMSLLGTDDRSGDRGHSAPGLGTTGSERWSPDRGGDAHSRAPPSPPHRLAGHEAPGYSPGWTAPPSPQSSIGRPRRPSVTSQTSLASSASRRDPPRIPPFMRREWQQQQQQQQQHQQQLRSRRPSVASARTDRSTRSTKGMPDPLQHTVAALAPKQAQHSSDSRHSARGSLMLPLQPVPPQQRSGHPSEGIAQKQLRRQPALVPRPRGLAGIKEARGQHPSTSATVSQHASDTQARRPERTDLAAQVVPLPSPSTDAHTEDQQAVHAMQIDSGARSSNQLATSAQGCVGGTGDTPVASACNGAAKASTPAAHTAAASKQDVPDYQQHQHNDEKQQRHQAIPIETPLQEVASEFPTPGLDRAAQVRPRSPAGRAGFSTGGTGGSAADDDSSDQVDPVPNEQQVGQLGDTPSTMTLPLPRKQEKRRPDWSCSIVVASVQPAISAPASNNQPSTSATQQAAQSVSAIRSEQQLSGSAKRSSKPLSVEMQPAASACPREQNDRASSAGSAQDGASVPAVGAREITPSGVQPVLPPEEPVLASNETGVWTAESGLERLPWMARVPGGDRDGAASVTSAVSGISGMSLLSGTTSVLRAATAAGRHAAAQFKASASAGEVPAPSNESLAFNSGPAGSRLATDSVSPLLLQLRSRAKSALDDAYAAESMWRGMQVASDSRSTADYSKQRDPRDIAEVAEAVRDKATSLRRLRARTVGWRHVADGLRGKLGDSAWRLALGEELWAGLEKFGLC